MNKKSVIAVLIACTACIIFALVGCDSASAPPAGGDEDNGTYYTVSFDSQGGTAVASQRILAGGRVTPPDTPTREGYAFLGWYKDDGATDEWRFDADAVSKDTTLYAGWRLQDDPSTTPDTPDQPDTPDPDTPDIPVTPPTPDTNENDILVVWFSYSNRTEGVANEIVGQSGGTGVEIIPRIPYTAEDTNYNNSNSRSQVERRTDARPEIADTTYDAIDMSEYETVIIGYPIWNGYEPMIIRTFIEHYDGLSDKDVYTFSTAASSGGGTAYSSVSGRCPDARMKGNLHLTSSALSDAQSRVRAWLTDGGLLKTEESVMYVTVNGHKLEVTLADNSSADALVEILKKGDITYTADDYGNFEKVGDIGHTLPRNDTQITTEAGDVILYQGRSICLYYDTNSWNFTRIGKINGYSASELRTLLGAGNGSAQITLSLTK